MRILLVGTLMLVTLSACSGSGSAPPKANQMSAETLEKNCADPKWRDENLGLWYSVCRRSASW